MNHQPRLVPVFFPFPGFPSVFLGSSDSAPGRPGLFANFIAPMKKSARLSCIRAVRIGETRTSQRLAYADQRYT
jgi:hypothetical protein